MTGETSGPSAQDIRMASFEEKFNDLLNFVRLLVKRDTESEKQVEDINKDTSEDNTGGHSHTNLGPPPVQPSKPEERDFQLDAKVEKTMRIDPNVAPENDPSPKGNWNTLEGPQSLQMYGNGEENVMNKKEDDHSDIRSLQGQPLYPSNQGDTIEPHSDVDGHSSKGQTGKYEVTKQKGNEKTPKARNSHASHGAIPIRSEIFLPSAKLKSESRKFCTLPMPMDELYPRLLEKRLISPVFLKQSPHLLHDSSKKCEFHFGRPGHSLEDCHALKNKVQDLVDHGILRINEGSTPSVIIAWPPEHRKDETVIPSPQSQGPTTCGIQPVHLTTLPTLSEVGEHTVPKTQPKLMSNFRNLDDQCSSDKEKAEYCTNRCVTLKRKIQELGHSELEVPVPWSKPGSQSEPFQGAPEPGSRIAKDEFSRPKTSPPPKRKKYTLSGLTPHQQETSIPPTEGKAAQRTFEIQSRSHKLSYIYVE
uniref:Retrotransposon gag domain-containing protein n=1 Tax=Fagus sylvatica TaxID=28930 RepID=A0A2N9G1D5_FAGSY